MKRLLERAQRRRNDPELFAGLAHVCRYCGLLQAALAAHQEARRLDPQIPTTVTHTYFMLGDYERALETSGGDFGYTTALILAALGRTDEALPVLQEKEQMYAGRLGTFYLISLRAFLQGKREESIKASEAILSGTFRDPEGLFYQARQLAYLDEKPMALEMFARAIDRGFFCYPVMLRDPWLDPLRGSTEFIDLLRKAQELHREATQAFYDLGGEAVLGAQQQIA
jgi:tetratricopeptide (TPR) repeat protein